MSKAAPEYMTNLIHMNSSRLQRSLNCFLLTIPKTRLKTKGDRAFSVAGPRLWNTLSPDIRAVPSNGTFKSRLKTCSLWLLTVDFFSVITDLCFMFCLTFLTCFIVIVQPFWLLCIIKPDLRFETIKCFVYDQSVYMTPVIKCLQ